MIGRPFAIACLVLGLALPSCERYPRDPARTLERVQGQELRIGISPDPPFVALSPGRPPEGTEVVLLQRWAESMDARIVWVEGAHDELLSRLESFHLDAVVGGLDPQTPWRDRIGLTRPFYLRSGDGQLHDRVLAVPPGENALLLHFERFAASPGAADLIGPSQQ